MSVSLDLIDIDSDFITVSVNSVSCLYQFCPSFFFSLMNCLFLLACFNVKLTLNNKGWKKHKTYNTHTTHVNVMYVSM